MTTIIDQDLRCKKCNGAMDRVKRRWYEKCLLVAAAFCCTWCGRRRCVSVFTYQPPETTAALGPQQLDEAKRTFSDDLASTEKDKTRTRQPVG